METLEGVLQYGKEILQNAKIEDADIDARLLLEYVCDIDRNYYLLHRKDQVQEQKIEQYKEVIAKRAAHIPLQHITGKAFFFDLEFSVNEHVLTPRFDTEILVEEVLKRMEPNMRILDMCTGSGCILLSLLHRDASIDGVGVDISEEALKVANENAGNLHIKTSFIQSDLFEHVEGTYDIIVSNPPYIPTKVIDTLQEEVKCYEPIGALDGLEDGLYFYREIIREASKYLNQKGFIFFEIGYDQASAVTELLENEYDYIQVVRDLAGLDRVVIGQRKKKNN